MSLSDGLKPSVNPRVALTKKQWPNCVSTDCSDKPIKTPEANIVTRPKILFVAEAVSLAHLLRSITLARTLDATAYDIHIACGEQYALFRHDFPWTHHRLKSISADAFIGRMARGLPTYTPAELERYAQDDLALLRQVKPDLIISDFRISLNVSARHLSIPLFNLSNAHWSSLLPERPMPLPDLWLAHILRPWISNLIFQTVWPVALPIHLYPINRLRRKYGQAPYRSIHACYCDGDTTLYADTPVLIPLPEQHPQHHFLGPVVWKPEQPEFPTWWAEAAATTGRRAYLTLGSTGKSDVLPTVVASCQAHGIISLVSTAGRKNFVSAPPSVYASQFLPGGETAALSDLVICNGGSGTAHQALAEGRPILGICSNMDQLLTMESIERAGAGLYLRATDANRKRLEKAIGRLLNEPGFSESARKIQAGFAEYDARRRFPAIIAAALGKAGG